MLEAYATGVAAIVALAVGWVAVQGAWRRAFPGRVADPDVLAGRTDCHGCERSRTCDGAGRVEEESS
jgi:hypothetical protein